MIDESNIFYYRKKLLRGDRAALAQCITLIESTHPYHIELASKLLDDIKFFTIQHSKRIGVTGTPGAGKSTLLNKLGIKLIELGHRVAVIAIDPSSPVSKGSLLGDKTRMPELSQKEQAFIRPVPTSGHLGGTSNRTREIILLCEAAGYDTIIVETVGVGQSETEISKMVDCFISLQIAGGGDELQGIKKGIMELVDLIVITKDDGNNKDFVNLAKSMYIQSLNIIRQKYSCWQPRVISCSAIQNTGIKELWDVITEFYDRMDDSGELQKLRKEQKLTWLSDRMQDTIVNIVSNSTEYKNLYVQLEKDILDNKISNILAVDVLSGFVKSKF